MQEFYIAQTSKPCENRLFTTKSTEKWKNRKDLPLKKDKNNPIILFFRQLHIKKFCFLNDASRKTDATTLFLISFMKVLPLSVLFAHHNHK